MNRAIGIQRGDSDSPVEAQWGGCESVQVLHIEARHVAVAINNVFRDLGGMVSGFGVSLCVSVPDMVVALSPSCLASS